YWFPKVTGRVLDERWGKVHFWMNLVGFHLTFFVQHILGLEGMPRRVADYLPSDGFTTLNRVSSVGAFLLGASTLPFLWNVWRTLRGRIGAVAGHPPGGPPRPPPRPTTSPGRCRRSARTGPCGMPTMAEPPVDRPPEPTVGPT